MGRVLVVEDEALVAMLLEDLLGELGYQVHACATLNEALASACHDEFAFAILDINLGTSQTYPAAEVLRTRGIPFAFATGYDKSGIEDAYSDVPVLHKPFDARRLRELIDRLR